MITNPFLTMICRIAQQAGELILELQQATPDLHVAEKNNGTPVTEIDTRVNEFIVSSLRDVTPGIQVVSEEDPASHADSRLQQQQIWLVDPLDGTAGFIKGSGEYSVNIALISENQPQLAVLYAPTSKTLYLAGRGEGAYCQQGKTGPKSIKARPADLDRLTFMLGLSNRNQSYAELLQEYPGIACIRHMHSSLKFAELASGQADVYPRPGKTSEWDTAAGQCILEAAGGAVVDFDGNALQYNASPSLINPSFVAIADRTQLATILTLLNGEVAS